MCVGGGGGGGVLNLQPSGRKVCCCGCVLPTSEFLSPSVCQWRGGMTVCMLSVHDTSYRPQYNVFVL